MVSLMQHDGALLCTEKEANFHLPVRQGGGKEAQTASEGGAAREFEEGPPYLQGTVEDRNIVQIYGKGADSGGLWLSGSVSQPKEG